MCAYKYYIFISHQFKKSRNVYVLRQNTVTHTLIICMEFCKVFQLKETILRNIYIYTIAFVTKSCRRSHNSPFIADVMPLLGVVNEFP